jgi:hypothetical protein
VKTANCCCSSKTSRFDPVRSDAVSNTAVCGSVVTPQKIAQPSVPSMTESIASSTEKSPDVVQGEAARERLEACPVQGLNREHAVEPEHPRLARLVAAGDEVPGLGAVEDRQGIDRAPSPRGARKDA